MRAVSAGARDAPGLGAPEAPASRGLTGRSLFFSRIILLVVLVLVAITFALVSYRQREREMEGRFSGGFRSGANIIGQHANNVLSLVAFTISSLGRALPPPGELNVVSSTALSRCLLDGRAAGRRPPGPPARPPAARPHPPPPLPRHCTSTVRTHPHGPSCSSPKTCLDRISGPASA